MPLETEEQFFDALTKEEHDVTYSRTLTTHHSHNGQTIETIYDYFSDTVTIATYNETYNPLTKQQELKEISKKTSDYSIEKYINFQTAKEENLRKKRDVNTYSFRSRILSIERVNGQILNTNLFSNNLDFLLNTNPLIRFDLRSSNPVTVTGPFNVAIAGNLVTATSVNTRFIFTIDSNQFTYFDGPTMAGRVYIGGSTVPRRITYVPSPTFAPTNPGETRAPSSSAPNSISPSAATSQPNSLAPITARPNSAAPSTVRPITRRPSSLAPITEEPTTGQPDSDAPTTARPNSAAPSSPRPSTARPSSASPSSQRPSTARPSSASPSSQRPTTRQPSSRRPTTFQPTLSPITEEPTTGRPNSNAPTTARPPIGGPSNVPSSLPVDQSTSAPIPQSQGTTRTPNAGTNSPSFLTPPSAIGTTGAPAQITRAPNTPPTTSDNPGDSSALSQIIIAVASAAFALSAGALLWKRYNKKPEEVNVEVIQSFRNPAFADRRTNGDDDYENPVPVAPNQYNEAGDPVSYEYEESDIHRDNKYEDPGEPDEVDPWYEVPEPIEDNGDYADISATTDSNNEDGYLDVGPGADPQEITNDAALYNTASPTIKPTREPTYAIASPDNSSNQGENPTYDTASGGLAPSAPETIYDIASRAFTQEADPNIPEKVYDMADTSQFGHHQPTTGPTYDVADPTVVTPQHQGSTHDAASADIILASPEAFEITTNTDLTEGFYDALTMPNADEVLDGPAVITKDVETFNGFGTRGIQQKDETFDGSSETEPTHHYPISTDPSVVTPGTAPLGSESQGPLEEKKKGKGK